MTNDESPSLDRIQPRSDCTVACIMLHDSNGRITHANEAFREMFRMPPGQVIGRLPEMLAAPGSTEGDAHNRRVAKAADRDGAVSFERVGVRTDGTRFIYRATVTALPTDRPEGGYCSVMEDVTEQRRAAQAQAESEQIIKRKEADERMRQMAERAVETLEAERNHISRELHDELGQDLVALKLDAAALAIAAEPLDAKLAERARQMGKLVDWTIGIIRRMASDLRPPALDDLGLAEAIEWLAAQVATRAKLNYKISVEPEDLRVPRAVATTAYRIVQESLTNIVKHANAHNVRIRLTLDMKQLTITIEDDGRGWPDDDAPDEGVGLRGMRERASLLGGALNVEVSDSGGACIKATLPTDSFERKEKR